MRALSMIAVALLAVPPLHAQSRVDRTLPLSSDGAIRVYALTGSVTVRGWDRDAVSIRGELGAGNRLHAGGGPGAVKAFVESSDDRNPQPSRLEIMVPARAKVWIKTATATVTVSDVRGGVDAYVIGGSIRVSGSPAELNAEAIDGSIEIVGTPGWVRARSAGGPVTLRGSSRDATLTTVTGRITVDSRGGGPRFERARFESVTGDIAFNGDVERGADVRFDTNGGAVEVTLRPGSSADLEVTTISGSIRNGLNSTRPVTGRYGRGGELATTAGDGGARLSVRTFNGAVTLKRGS